MKTRQKRDIFFGLKIVDSILLELEIVDSILQYIKRLRTPKRGSAA